MPTRIRLQRVGRKKQASFRIVVTDKAEANSGPALETLGTYNPRTRPSLVKLDTAAALTWLHEGAVPTDTVVSIFKRTGVWEKFVAGETAEAIDAEQAVVKLGLDPKTSGRAKAAEEGEKLAAQRRAEEKAAAEAAARKAAAEKAAAAKAAAEAEAAAEEAEEAEEEADEAAEVVEAEAEAAVEDEAPETPADEAEEAPEAAADEAEDADEADDEADEADDDAGDDEDEK